MKQILSKIFNIAVKRRNLQFDLGKKKIHHCVSPVISVGNISVGGSGKTPFVQYLVNNLIKFGYRPGIVGRGYKRKSKGEIIISDGKTILTDAKTGGDEMLLLAESLRVPISAHDLKYQGALRLESMFDIDCIVIDDGFQHRQLYRDLDIVLLDLDTILNPSLLPKGRLREPLSSIHRADVICLMGDIDIFKYDLQNYCENKFIIKINAKPGMPYLSGSPGKKYVHDKNIVAVSGIAKPEKFKIMLQGLDYNVIENISFDDHHNYSTHDVQFIINKCSNKNIKNIITTQKDEVKIREFGNVFAESGIGIIVIPLSLNILEGEDDFNKLLKITMNKGKK